MYFLLILILIIPFAFLSSNTLLLVIIESLLFILFFLRQSRKLSKGEITEYPFVSIIVPVRNEEENIVDCLNSLALLDYPNFEVIIANDSSTDKTKELAQKVAYKYSNVSVKFFDAPTPPKGWIGKSWAVGEAIKQIKGSLILVADADIRHKPESLKSSVSYFLNKEADIMIRFPYPVIKSVGEWPLLFSIFILRFASWFSLSLLKIKQSFAFGEYVIFSKKFYNNIGGYNEVKGYIAESLALVNIAFKYNKKVFIFDDDNKEITMRMYKGGKDTLGGLMRNIDFNLVKLFPFLGIFIMIGFSIDGILNMSLGYLMGESSVVISGLISYLMFSIFFGAYLILSKQSFYIALISPFLGIYFILVTILAGIRDLFEVSVNWRERNIMIK